MYLYYQIVKHYHFYQYHSQTEHNQRSILGPICSLQLKPTIITLISLALS